MSYIERPYRQLYPPEPVRKRPILTTKDDLYVDENGVEVRVPVEERPTRKIIRTTTFGTEIVEEPIP